MVREKKERGGLDAIKKWIGLAAALASFGSALYGVLRVEADVRERKHEVTAQLAAGREQQTAGDYAQAWESFERARKAAEKEGSIQKLLGSSAQVQQVRAAQEDLLMEWVRGARGTDFAAIAAISDKTVSALTSDLDSAAGSRKADMLAHIGWAYFLKRRNDEGVGDPMKFYREALALDPQNPYANVFWGHQILWNHGSLAQARQYFATALASNRARAVVREFQLAALGNERGPEDAEPAWWQAVDEMHKDNEPLDERTLNDMVGKYQSALRSDADLAVLFAAVPPAEHVELLRLLLRSAPPDRNAGNVLSVKVALAAALEAAGRPEESLATWRDVQASTQGDPSFIFDSRINAALKRLSSSGGKTH